MGCWGGVGVGGLDGWWEEWEFSKRSTGHSRLRLDGWEGLDIAVVENDHDVVMVMVAFRPWSVRIGRPLWNPSAGSGAVEHPEPTSFLFPVVGSLRNLWTTTETNCDFDAMVLDGTPKLLEASVRFVPWHGTETASPPTLEMGHAL